MVINRVIHIFNRLTAIHCCFERANKRMNVARWAVVALLAALRGCTVVTVDGAAVGATVTAVKVGAAVVGTAADVTVGAVRLVTGSDRSPAPAEDEAPRAAGHEAETAAGSAAPRKTER